MEPGGSQYRGNGVRAAGFTKETSLKIEQASRECVCVCGSAGWLRTAAHTGLEISLFCVQDILYVLK